MIDILVLTYNRLKYLKIFIEMLYLSTSEPFKLIVIDNGSVDGTRDFIVKLEKEGLIYKHVFNDKNLPLAAAFTEGFKLVTSKYFITVADDMIPPFFKSPDWLEIFKAKMDSDESIGCINFVGARCSFNAFHVKTRPLIENRIRKEGGRNLELFNKFQKIIYEK